MQWYMFRCASVQLPPYLNDDVCLNLPPKISSGVSANDASFVFLCVKINFRLVYVDAFQLLFCIFQTVYNPKAIIQQLR